MAHGMSGTIRGGEWIPIFFGPIAGVILLAAGLLALRRRAPATRLATLVFFASIIIPFMKLVCMCWLLMMHGSDRLRPQRAKAFHILHQVGTWSMIVIFLLSVLAAVGQLGILASVEPQPGVVFFAAVLLCTLFAADIYQPRMIWKPSPTA